ncbi:hypothetical protein RUW00_22015 [Bacillus sp. IS1]|uniref:hypothetical protein n=1 Tax=Bacillus TaxID=1386 RepID=UPI0028FAC9C4|nr:MULTISPECIES: hypothetical protein [unclassified Bacillus (in: firmicutes)]MDU0078200.1 hypothetical protein [Bacillus sp. IG2]MDU0103909.1 hypothetical protein [Bacillus sp. IS1]
MTMERYLKLRYNGKTMKEIQNEYELSDSTVWTLELGYTCFLKGIPLDEAVKAIFSIESPQVH